MLDYLFHLLPEWLQAKIQPELDHLIADFTRLDRQFNKLIQRHLVRKADLNEARRFLDVEISAVEHELARTERVAAKIADLVR